MKLSRGEVTALVIVLVSVIVGAVAYQYLPAQVASHWNEAGEVNGYMSKFWGAFLMPVITAGMFLIFLVIPRIDPKRQNIEKFRPAFDRFIVTMFIFMFYVYLLTLWWNFDYRFNIVGAIVPAFAILFYAVGALVGKAKQNWTVGIRTPWTLASETVWNKTHLLASKLIKAAAVLTLVSIVVPRYSFWIAIGSIVLAVLYPAVYSYVEYRRETRPA